MEAIIPKDTTSESQYIASVMNPTKWFHAAEIQKKIGDSILSNILLKRRMLFRLLGKSNEFQYFWINVHYHYAIGIENGLKGLIILRTPSAVRIDVGNGRAALRSIGTSGGKTHNLVSLARDSGIFESQLFKFESDRKAFCVVLDYLSDAIKWTSRYPVPNASDSAFSFDGSVPVPLVYGFHILDVIDPVFAYFRGKSRASRFKSLIAQVRPSDTKDRLLLKRGL